LSHLLGKTETVAQGGDISFLLSWSAALWWSEEHRWGSGFTSFLVKASRDDGMTACSDPGEAPLEVLTN
jgi:hypothetical protein